MSLTLEQVRRIDPEMVKGLVELKEIEGIEIERRKDFIENTVNETILLVGTDVFQRMAYDLKAFRNGELKDPEFYCETVFFKVIFEMERLYKEGKNIERLMHVVNLITSLTVNWLRQFDGDGCEIMSEQFQILASAEIQSEKFIEFRNQYVGGSAVRLASDLIDKLDQYDLENSSRVQLEVP